MPFYISHMLSVYIYLYQFMISLENEQSNCYVTRNYVYNHLVLLGTPPINQSINHLTSPHHLYPSTAGGRPLHDISTSFCPVQAWSIYCRCQMLYHPATCVLPPPISPSRSWFCLYSLCPSVVFSTHNMICPPPFHLCLFPYV